jgi:hypothetical protein
MPLKIHININYMETYFAGHVKISDRRLLFMGRKIKRKLKGARLN